MIQFCAHVAPRRPTRPAVEVLKLFDAAIFYLIIGNADAHGKNFSLLGADRQAGTIRGRAYALRHARRGASSRAALGSHVWTNADVRTELTSDAKSPILL